MHKTPKDMEASTSFANLPSAPPNTPTKDQQLMVMREGYITIPPQQIRKLILSEDLLLILQLRNRNNLEAKSQTERRTTRSMTKDNEESEPKSEQKGPLKSNGKKSKKVKNNTQGKNEITARRVENRTQNRNEINIEEFDDIAVKRGRELCTKLWKIKDQRTLKRTIIYTCNKRQTFKDKSEIAGCLYNAIKAMKTATSDKKALAHQLEKMRNNSKLYQKKVEEDINIQLKILEGKKKLNLG